MGGQPALTATREKRSIIYFTEERGEEGIAERYSLLCLIGLRGAFCRQGKSGSKGGRPSCVIFSVSGGEGKERGGPLSVASAWKGRKKKKKNDLGKKKKRLTLETSFKKKKEKGRVPNP